MPQQPPKRTTRVRNYTRSDGTKVRSHDRRLAWKKAAAAWSGTAASGALSVALVLELGFTIISALAMLLTAIIGALAVKYSQQMAAPRRRMRANTRPAPRRRTTSTQRKRK